MKKMLASLLLFATQASLAAPLAAVMNFESMSITAEGVKKQTQFQEQLVRDDNVIWTQRMVPANAPKNIAAGEEHEHNLNFALAGKWLVRNKNNQVSFRFVRTDEKKIIEPRVNEYGSLGFDGQWETAYYLLNREALKKMHKLDKPAPAGASWFEKRDTTEYTRVLWDDNNQIPLSIESGKFDGSLMDRITLRLVSAPKQLPWNDLAGFSTIAYEDLLD